MKRLFIAQVWILALYGCGSKSDNLTTLQAREKSSSTNLVEVSSFAEALSDHDLRSQWPAPLARAWQREHRWLVGVNYIPRSASNQLEMWQVETFDPKTIDQELSWAEDLGFTSLRVFLHILPWREDPAAYLRRIDEFLAIADRHHLGVMLVLLDCVWNPLPKAGPQPPPRPNVHNAGWVQNPGIEILKGPSRYHEVEDYIKGIVGHFAKDPRIDVWDVFNEPENRNLLSYGDLEPENKEELALDLIHLAFEWVRDSEPRQPLTSGVWMGDFEYSNLSDINRFMLLNSDVISYHSYLSWESVETILTNLEIYHRPILCTEWMGRGMGSNFDPLLEHFKEGKIGAYSWGLVNGRAQSIFTWGSWIEPPREPPAVWFHDILDKDGKPFDPAEVEYIKRVLGKAP